MSTTPIRWHWLKGMYIYTAAGAGLLGIALLIVPSWITALLNMPVQDPVILGAVASCYVAFGLLALLGLRTPLRFVPILLLQMTYKSVWLLAVFLPMAVGGELPLYSVLFALIFASYIVGDFMAIPFRLLWPKEDRDT